MDQKREIMDVLVQGTDTICRFFLEKRYLENKTEYEIADAMNCSKSWAKYCHRKELFMVGEILLKSGRTEKPCP